MNKKSKKIKGCFQENLEIELKNRNRIEEYGYDFIPRTYHWEDIDEQKIQVNKIEEITTMKKRDKLPNSFEKNFYIEYNNDDSNE